MPKPTEAERQDYLTIRDKVKAFDKGVLWHRDGVYHVGVMRGYGMQSKGSSRVSYAEAWQDYLNQKGV